MVKPDPLLGLSKSGAVVAIIGIIGAVWAAFALKDIVSLLAILWLVPVGAALFWYFSPWAQVEHRRQLAAGKIRRALRARKQPKPNEAALSLPFTIKLRPKWTIPLICFGILTPLTSGLLLRVVYTAPSNPPVPDWVPIIIVGTSVFGSALVASIPLILGWQRIKVSEKGIKVQECSLPSIGCNERTIKWSEARLFAIYPARKPNDPRVYYELAGRTAIVRWRRMRPDAPFRFSKPPASFYEYDRQMDALLSLIAAKTGLPLYDLR